MMPSIYRLAMGPDFDRLHPQMQRRLGVSTDGEVACIGRGVMEKIWHGPFYVVPFLYLGSWRRILFPDSATNVSFTIENYAYTDRFGRETVTWNRTFHFPKPRRFDATFIYSQQRRSIVDYLGTHQHLATDLAVTVNDRGGILLRSGPMRLHEHWVHLAVPKLMTGHAEVCEWYDDPTGRFRIEVNVLHPWIGSLFGYTGWFTAEWPALKPEDVPAAAKPVREVQRE
jgi:hypothetical protein